MASGEDELIARFFRPLATHPGALALTDDAAVLEPPAGHDLVLTADALTAGIHFFPDDPPDAVARKALRVNLSDLTAKGAKPLGFLMTLALPSPLDESWLEKFAGGLRMDATAFDCPLFGGDTTKTTGPVSISISALGSVPHGKMVRRSGARPGDRVLVTGTIGDAALGLMLRRQSGPAQSWPLDAASRTYLLNRYLVPQPPLGLVETLRTHASAAMDVSDGLAGDFTKLCDASGVSAEIHTAAVPLSAAAKTVLAAQPTLVETVLSGGDDYEVVLTMQPDRVAAFRAQAQALNVAIAEIGIIVAGKAGPRFLDATGAAVTLSHISFSHF